MTHYDTLGVAPDASDPELRAAYRRRARQVHPDLRGQRTPAQRAQRAQRAHSEREMQRLNEAWHVLHEPDRRRRYDRSLGEFRADVRHPEPATDTPPVHVNEPNRPTRVLPVMALLGAALICMIAVASIILHETSTRAPDDGVGAVIAGDCVKVRSGHISKLVPCDSGNDGQVVSEIRRGQSCATTSDRLVDGHSGSTFVCLDTTRHP